MRGRFVGVLSGLSILIAALGFSPALCAQSSAPSDSPKDSTAATSRSHDLSGMWMEYPGSGAIDEKARPPLTPWGQARFDTTYPQLGPRAVPGKENDPSVTRCQPEGVPKVIIHPNPYKIVQIPGRVFIFYEEHHVWRTIWTDGRPLPENPKPTWLGYSVGKWEGDTFVVDTIGFNDQPWMDSYGNPRSEQLHLTERYRRLNHDTLELTMTLDDPKAYTAVWTNPPKLHKLEPDWDFSEFFCTIQQENAYEQSVSKRAGETSAPK
jgi:hypothetical protein